MGTGVMIRTMDLSCSNTLPWSTPPLWQAATQTMAFTIRQYRGALLPVIDLSRRIYERIHTVDSYMTHLCNQTCPRCQDICCGHAHAYFDFKDLLYLHLSQGRLPAHQTLEKSRQTCRYLNPNGCILPRTERPFICTWYICPDQRACLEQVAPSAMLFLLNSLKALKTGRNQLEAAYIRTTAGIGLAGHIL